MASILPFDELNAFIERLRGRFSGGQLPTGNRDKEEEEDIIDELLDLFLLAYATGNSVTNENLSSNWKPTLDEVMETVDQEVAGKTWRSRIEEYFQKAESGEISIAPRIEKPQQGSETGQETGSATRSSENKPQSSSADERGADKRATGTGETNLTDAIIRIAETETHRIANESALDTARHGGARTKTWATMLDDKVRETHDYLEGQTVDIEEEFFTYDGDHAFAPGLFELAENNVNCRCELLFSK